MVRFLNTEIVKGIGAAYGTAKSGIGIAGVGTFRPDLVMKVGAFYHPEERSLPTVNFSLSSRSSCPVSSPCTHW